MSYQDLEKLIQVPLSLVPILETILTVQGVSAEVKRTILDLLWVTRMHHQCGGEMSVRLTDFRLTAMSPELYQALPMSWKRLFRADSPDSTETMDDVFR